jgi:ankyrin repeat protein
MAFPESIQKKACDGVLPLHLAASCQKDKYGQAVVEALLAAYPEATREKTDEGGYLPLHLAARSQHGAHGLAVVEALLAAYPEGVLEKNNDGTLPLVIAQGSNYTEIGITALLKEAADSQRPTRGT